MALKLKDVRRKLISLEDDIIACILERAQFGACNGSIAHLDSLPDAIKVPDIEIHPTAWKHITLTEDIKRGYIDFVHKLCKNRNKNPNRSKLRGIFKPQSGLPKSLQAAGYEPTLSNHECPVQKDIKAFKIISYRIHYASLYIAESKFQEDPDSYTTIIRAGDRDGIMAKLTIPEKEQEIFDRVRGKAAEAQKGIRHGKRVFVEPEIIIALYRDMIIPITKKGEVEYLMHRLD